MLRESPYQSYVYAYPHKTAYRRLDPPVPLRDVWADEDRESLFLYMHVPFCEYRCGFCNLFTQANPIEGLTRRYLEQTRIEAESAREALVEPRFTRLAIGGGTPTFLTEGELHQFLSIATDVMGARPREIPVSVEASPATVTPAKLALLRDYGADRLSLGVQTFDDSESSRLGRPQRRAEVERALGAIRDVGFPSLNLDLIYGGEGQSVESFLGSLRRAVEWQPEELYLYPLYIRQLTGLDRLGHDWDDVRMLAYREGRDYLTSAGYEQISMRMFQKQSVVADSPQTDDASEKAAPRYCCQADGMVGVGCGARSYTRTLHYSHEFAVSRKGVGGILSEYLQREPAGFEEARHGFRLNPEEERRRYVVLSLFQRDGLLRTEYRHRFQADVLDEVPAIAELEPAGLAEVRDDRIVLTDAGLERSDALGPWLFSQHVRRLMEDWECH
ncbi:MAG: STM4012 family radical SAM protein [Planctomycetaceae bacterium]|nr:STM4012 family radical SAM protein [Planctomycetaceae bacterium]